VVKVPMAPRAKRNNVGILSHLLVAKDMCNVQIDNVDFVITIVRNRPICYVASRAPVLKFPQALKSAFPKIRMVSGILRHSLLLAIQMSKCLLNVASLGAVFQAEKENTGGG